MLSQLVNLDITPIPSLTPHTYSYRISKVCILIYYSEVFPALWEVWRDIISCVVTDRKHKEVTAMCQQMGRGEIQDRTGKKGEQKDESFNGFPATCLEIIFGIGWTLAAEWAKLESKEVILNRTIQLYNQITSSEDSQNQI